MGYYTRVFCKGSVPSLESVSSFLNHAGVSMKLTTDESLVDSSWQNAEVTYKAGKLPILVECNRPGGEGLFEDEIAEFLQQIGSPGLSLAKRKVIKHLNETKFIVACQLPTSDIDDDGYDVNGEFMKYFVANCGGIIQCDGEGLYYGNKVVVALK
jgi:hypothetical protein